MDCPPRMDRRAGTSKSWKDLLAALTSVGLSAAAILSGGAASASASNVKTTVLVASVGPLGPVLVSPTHHTLYVFADDKPGVSDCTGKCAAEWPPYLLAPGEHTVTAPKGLHGLGVIHRRGGRLQVTLNHKPLYFFIGDKKARQHKGQGVASVWFAVHPNGKNVILTGAAAPSVSTNPSTPTSTAGASTVPGSTAKTTTPKTASAPPTTRPPNPNTPAGTSPPVTSPPATSPPVINPPVTSPPVTSPPVTSPPVTSPPVTSPPVTSPPPTSPPGGGGYGY